jgi:Fe-S-cluster containining protein
MSGKNAKKKRMEARRSNIENQEKFNNKLCVELHIPSIEKRADIINNIFTKGVSEVYHQIDEIIKINAPFLKYSCKKRCDYCCYGPVEIYYIEAKYISENANVKIKENFKIFNREEYQQKIFFEGNYFKKCPFLKNKECSIYEFRPFICRIFHSMSDPEICKEAYNDSTENKEKYLINLINKKYKIDIVGHFEESERYDNLGNKLLDFKNEFLTGLYVMIAILNDSKCSEQKGSKGDIRDYFDEISIT